MEEEQPNLTAPGSDKRRFRRANLVTHVRCEALGREDLLLTRDVSVGGLFLLAKKGYPAKSDIFLSFHLSPTDPVVSCRATVAYAVPGVGIGIEFVNLGEKARQALQKFVDQGS